MKKSSFLYLSLATIVAGSFSSCQEFDAGYSISDVVYAKYQTYKLDCVNEELALSTNFYGMGPVFEDNEKSAITRTEHAHQPYSDWATILYAYEHNPLSTAAPIDEAWWILIKNSIGVHCDKNGGGYSIVDMPGFNGSDRQGLCVFINKSEQKPNVSWCPNGQEHHQPWLEHKTDGVYHFVEVHAYDDQHNDIISKVYVTFDYNIADVDYMLCIEDLGGSCLDFNDLVIIGGQQMQYPRVIFRRAALPIKIYENNNVVCELPGNDTERGECNIPIPLNNMNNPNKWNNANIRVEADGKVIPFHLHSRNDMPAVIATKSSYQIHKDENSMTSQEFKNIPFYQ